MGAYGGRTHGFLSISKLTANSGAARSKNQTNFQISSREIPSRSVVVAATHQFEHAGVSPYHHRWEIVKLNTFPMKSFPLMLLYFNRHQGSEKISIPSEVRAN